LIDGAEQEPELWTNLPELLAVRFRKSLEDAVSGGSECEINFATVERAARLFDVAAPDKPVDQPDGAMVEDLKSRGEFAHGDAFFRCEAFDGQQCLVLLRSDAGRGGSTFAEAQEPSKSVAKFGEDLVFARGNARLSSGHAGSMADDTRAVDGK
jgi:hypothetical protein